MNFLNVGPWELTVVLMIAILMVGPKRMVDLARTIRRYATQLRKLSGEFTSVLQTEIQATEVGARQVLGEVRQVVEDTQAAAVDALGEANTSGQRGRPSAEDTQATGGDDRDASTQESTRTPEPTEEAETRPLLDVFKDGLGITSMQAEMAAIGQETRDVLGSALSGGLVLSDLQEEIRAVGEETRQAVSDVGQTVKSSVASVSNAPTESGSTGTEPPQREEFPESAVGEKGGSAEDSEEMRRSLALDAEDPLSPLKNIDNEQTAAADSPSPEVGLIEEEAA